MTLFCRPVASQSRARKLPVEQFPGFVKIDDFSASTAFAKFGATGAVVADTTTGYRNNRSLKITTDGSANYTDIRASSSSFNATGKTLAIAVYCPTDLAKITDIQVTVATDTLLANRYRFSYIMGTQTPGTMLGNQWQLLTLPWGYGGRTGSFDSTNVTEYQVRVCSNGNGSANLWIGYMAWIDVHRTAASVSFDDGYESAYLQAFPVLQSMGIPFTLYMPYTYLNSGGRLSLSEIQTMMASGLCEIGWHYTGSDMTVYTAAQVKSFITSGIAGWQSQGINNVRSAAYPGGQWGYTTDNVYLCDIFANYFSSCRTICYSPGDTIPCADTMLIRPSRYMYNSTTPATVSSQITKDASNGGWHQQVYHDIVTGTPSTDQYNISNFTTNMTNLVNSGMKISKFSDVVYY